MGHCLSYPEPTCDYCLKRWESSGLEKMMKDVKWHLIHRKADIKDLVCFGYVKERMTIPVYLLYCRTSDSLPFCMGTLMVSPRL